MSDCSTQATMRKERRTCGNCGHAVQSNVFCRESDGSTAGLHSMEERGCRKWIGRTDTLEQRYEHLEQVAREMLTYIGSFTLLMDHRYNDRDAARENARRFMEFDEQINECGGSVDDVG